MILRFEKGGMVGGGGEMNGKVSHCSRIGSLLRLACLSSTGWSVY